MLIYYLTPPPGTRLMRLNLADLSTREVMALAHDAVPRKLAVSPDERWLVAGPFLVRDNVFRLDLIDLANGKRTTLCELKDIPNPHPQFDPGNPGAAAGAGEPRQPVHSGRGLSKAQRTAGGHAVPCGRAIGRSHAASRGICPTRRRSPGIPPGPGGAGIVVFTTAPGVHESLLAGTGVYRLTPGEARPVQIVSGQPFNHLAVSDDGRFFIVDDYRTQTIHIGSVETGRFLKLCDSRTRQGKPQYTHAHPYLTPDNRHVIFNSNVTGVTQVYAATVPAAFLDKLEMSPSHETTNSTPTNWSPELSVPRGTGTGMKPDRRELPRTAEEVNTAPIPYWRKVAQNYEFSVLMLRLSRDSCLPNASRCALPRLIKSQFIRWRPHFRHQ